MNKTGKAYIYGVYRHCQQYFSYISWLSVYIGGGNRRKPSMFNEYRHTCNIKRVVRRIDWPKTCLCRTTVINMLCEIP